MRRWVVLTGVEIYERFINTEDVILVGDEEQAEQIMKEYLDKHPDRLVVGFKITKEAMRDE